MVYDVRKKLRGKEKEERERRNAGHSGLTVPPNQGKLPQTWISASVPRLSPQADVGEAVRDVAQAASVRMQPSLRI